MSRQSMAALLTLLLPAALPAAPPADLVLLHGKVFTGDSKGSMHEAVAIRDGKFLATGTTRAIRALAGPKTKIIDLKQRLVTAGFIDAHVHPIGLGIPNYLDVSSARNIADIQQAIAARAAKVPANKWIRGGGWLEENLKGNCAPTRHDLDPVSDGHPVVLYKKGWHALLANSAALRRAGITRDTPNPPRGEIVCAANGEPTGLLSEAAMFLLTTKVPHTAADTRLGLQQTCIKMLEYGITTAHFSSVWAERIPIFQKLYQESGVPIVRAVLRPRLYVVGRKLPQLLPNIRRYAKRHGTGNDRLRIGAMKIFVDGGITTQSALFTQAYDGRPKHFGIQNIETKMLNGIFLEAHRLGLPIHCHTTGDRAIDLVLNAIELSKKEFPKQNPRHSITHAYLVPSNTSKRLADLNVAVVLQPNFIHSFGARFAKSFGEKRLVRAIPVRTLLNAGVPVAFSSDNIPLGPLRGLASAVHRVGLDGRRIGPDQEIPLAQAIRLYTIAGAQLTGEAARKGSIEPGKLADAVVFDRNLFSLPVKKLPDAKVAMTILGGEIVFKRE